MGNRTHWPLRRGREALRDLVAMLPSAGEITATPARSEPPPSPPLSVDELAAQLALILKRPK